MALSGSNNYTITASGVITEALRRCGVLDQAATASSAQLTDILPAFEMFLKSLSNHGLELWTIKRDTITLVESKLTYEVTFFEGKALRITDVFYRDSDGNDTTMIRMQRDEYNLLNNKDLESNLPTQYYFDPRLDESEFTIWPVANSSIAGDKIYITAQTKLDDIDSATNDIDVPSEWYEAIVWGLSKRIMLNYAVPRDIRREIRLEAEDSLELALDFDIEDGSIYLQPDNSGQNG